MLLNGDLASLKCPILLGRYSREHMLGTAYLVCHTCYALCMLYVSRGLSKLRKKSLLNDLYGEDNASTSPHPHIRIGYIGLSKHAQYLQCY